MCPKKRYGLTGKTRQGTTALLLMLLAVASAPATGSAEEPTAYTKIANSGRELPLHAKLGNRTNDWACTRDEATGLIWEIKTQSGLRSWRHLYSWHDGNPATHGGFAGSSSGGVCHAPGRCDTEKYVEDVNAQGLCGHRDWRMPSREELTSLIRPSRSRPSIDTRFFPNTPPRFFWSASARAWVPIDAWSVGFNRGSVIFANKYGTDHVRLVRAGKTAPVAGPLDVTPCCLIVPLPAECR